MIDVALTLEEVRGIPLAGVTAVVLDVVRASTTIVGALAGGARAVVPVATPDEARALGLGGTVGPVLIGGERGGAPPPGFDRGNSPAEYTPERVRGRTVAFTTTNGTRALLALDGARRIAVGGFVNAAAVARWVAAEPGDALLVCAGERGRFCLEDAVCAGLLVSRLATVDHTLTDAAQAAQALWERYADDLGAMLAAATWAQALVAQGRGADLPLCVALDVHGVVPVLRNGVLVASDGNLTPLGAPRHNDVVRRAPGDEA
ncbi:MAG: 2-phosphosulfolactate phosphatase [Candidatus Rokubacteria bacterium]|nr:2-phosphosulfolactate phosphatase [Candidatus Rokubacteria bacterium]